MHLALEGSRLLYLLFFLSGVSGLIYQVVWVREFGNVFGNTVYSASLVVAVFMLGLGAGGYLVGRWADRLYAQGVSDPAPTGQTSRPDTWRPASAGPNSLLRSYGAFEVVIGSLGLGVSLLLPHLGRLSALVSSYGRDTNGWFVLSPGSYAARTAIAVLLLTPITLLMGGTLTLLIRHLVRSDPITDRWRIAVLYGINTAGAAAGAFLTDFWLVPTMGLQRTQIVAAGLNMIAGIGAWWLATRPHVEASRPTKARRPGEKRKKRDEVRGDADGTDRLLVPMTGLALALAGFAAMGMEIVWFRHFTILLGGFRAVFSLLLTVILIGIGGGSLLASLLERRSRSVTWLIVVQVLFVVSVLAGLAAADARGIDDLVTSSSASRSILGAVGRAADDESGFASTLAELWFNARPMLLEIGLPVLLMGFTFPLANAVIQRAERAVGRRAGVLYFSNTVGAVCGSLIAGFVLLPASGLQTSATVLMVVATLAIVPLFLADYARMTNVVVRTGKPARSAKVPIFAASGLLAGIAVALWLRLPSDYIIERALARPADTERVLVVREGLNEAIQVTEQRDGSRRLLTNGHPMSATNWLSQRYMRALAHIPLLAIEDPGTVLVIGFGVGNTAHAATLHPSIRRVEVADLSKDILAASSHFTAVNGGVLQDPRVAVYVNDGRQHLQMQPPGRYDLITLEPPPIGYAGVASLYSKEFYGLARSRLTPKGYISQWLPAYQVPGATTLAMVRAFVDVFPEAVLISGAEADLVLVGANQSSIQIDPDRLAAVLSKRPRAQADLQRLSLGSVRDIVGTFVASSRRLADAVREHAPVTDDRPIQEYGVRSLLDFGEAVPGAIVDLSEVAAWCPKCFANGAPVSIVEGLDTYLALLGRAYLASPADVAKARTLGARQQRVIEGSVYLGTVVPETADLHNFLGITRAQNGELDEAIAQFREAVNLAPEDAATHWHLGAALAARGARDEAVAHLQRSVELDPSNADARRDLDAMRQRR